MSKPPLDPAETGTRVLVVDDDDLVRGAVVRMIRADGRTVLAAGSAEEALRIAGSEELDVVISDLRMPGIDGLMLLTKLRENNLDLPVIFLTGSPSIETAASAVAQGAFRYLLKPIDRAELTATLDQAERVRALSRARDPRDGRNALEANFRSAIDKMWMALQPIVQADSGTVIGYEALLRSREPSLPHPGAVLDAAEKLSAVHTLGRKVRGMIAEIVGAGPEEATYFVNLHPSDLADEELADASAPLSQFASRIVLELTERATLEGVGDLQRRMSALRTLGYRIAIDDLGAGYAGLSYFAVVRPEIVKIDMSLVRGVDGDEIKQRVISSIVLLARSMGIRVVAEGVETAAELDSLVGLGCDLLQGYLIARPGPPYPTSSWRAVS